MDTELIEQTISAAIDGELVDVDVLRQALATPAGRDALAAFVLLRAATSADALASAAEIASAPATRPRRAPVLRMVSRYRVPAALAASLATLAVAGAFWLGSALQTPQVTVQLAAPPATRPVFATAPSPVVVVEPAVVRPCTPPPAPQPPQPTRIVRYVRGVDWSDVTSQ